MQIYVDYNASSPIAPEVRAAIVPFLDAAFGNPSSLHWAGRPARAAIEAARVSLAELLHAAPEEIVFTSGGTESNNHAIKGAYGIWARGIAGATSPSGSRPAPHFVTTAIEHPAVTLPLAYLRDVHGAEVTELLVDAYGRVDPSAVEQALRPETVLVSVMHANNETGVLQPIAEIGSLCRSRNVLFHTDAAQSVGKVPVDLRALQVDLLTVAGHKLLAPKGVGALYVRTGLRLEPLLHGAGHEHGRRSGTENTPWIVGLGAAAALAARHLAEDGVSRVARLRDRLEAGIAASWGDGAVFHGAGAPRLPNTSSVAFVGRIGAEVLGALDGVAASTGAACHSGVVELSRALRAMGVREQVGMGTIRFSLGRGTTEAEVDAVVSALAAVQDGPAARQGRTEA